MAVPLNWLWFDPGAVVVSDGSKDREPTLLFDRVIKRETKMSYHVTVRDAADFSVVCDAQSGPFTYRPDATLPKPITITWWSGGDDTCWPLEPGIYVMETCWEAHRPFWGSVPPKTICRISNPFRITAVDPEEAERAIQEQESLKEQVEELTRGLKAIQRREVSE